MKKILFMIIILFIIFYNINTKAIFVKKIDLKIKEDETSIVFLKLKNSTSLLINDEDDSNLFIIDYKNDNELKEVIKIFGSEPDIFYLNRNANKRIDNVHVFNQSSILKFRISNYTLCIYENKGIISNCDFVYLMKLNSEFLVNESLLAIFYDEEIDEKYLKDVLESWNDNSIISANSFTILKLNEDSYNILVVPSTNN